MGYDRANTPDREENITQPDISTWSVEFDIDWSASQQQRDQANEDIRFIMVQGGQWEGFLGDQFASNRPRMEMDRLYEKVNTFMSQYAETKPGIVFHPGSGSNTSQDDCKLLNGMYRADMRRNNGYYAVYNAVHEAVLGGIGGFRVKAHFEDEEDDENINQNIGFEPIQSAYSSIIWDANAKRYDKRDARHCNVITFLTTSAFEERFPGYSPSSVPVGEDRREFNWNSPGGAYIAERYWVEHQIKTSVLLRNPDTGDSMSMYLEDFKLSIADLDASGYVEIRRRKKNVKLVKKAIYSGSDILEEEIEIAGKHIPIVPVYAFWMFVDGQEQYLGMVRKQKDAQRLFNMQASSLAELAATSIKEAPIFAPEQMNGPGIKELWSQAHLGKFNYLLVEPLRDEAGTILSAGPIGTIKPPSVDPALAAIIQLTSEYITNTGTMNPVDIPNREISGAAIQKITKRVDLKTYLIMENVYNSLILAGDIYKDMAAEIYADSRDVTVLESDGTDRQVEINTQQMNVESGQMERVNDLAGKKFECYSDVGPSYSSMREEWQEMVVALLDRVPQESPYYAVLMAELVDLIDGTSDELKAFNRKQMLKLGLREPETDEDKKYMEGLAEQAKQPSPEDQLVLAATENEKSQAAENAANAEESKSKVPVNLSQVELNKARAAEQLSKAEENTAGAFEKAASVLQFPQSRTGGR